MNKNNKIGIIFAILAAALYAISTPLSKFILSYMPQTLLAGFLYLGAGVGMAVLALIRKSFGTVKIEQKLTKKELPYVITMVLLDIIAPICLLYGLKYTTASNTCLLNNFEIVATALIALFVFKEKISIRLWCGIILVTVACMLLSFDDISSLKFSYGSLLVILACIAWGFENNCTKKISSKDPMEIVVIKGIFSGLGSIIIGLSLGERISEIWLIFAVLGIGFIAYGLSIFFYVYAQRTLGAARTSAYYAISPFIGVALSLVLFRQIPHYIFYISLSLMAVGAWLCSQDKPLLKRKKIN